jgi:uncharacterized protein YprB with RNaseH-like and TPR domain
VSETLQERLGRLARGGRAPAPPATTGRRRRPPPELAAILPGEELRTDRGVCWRHERPLENWPGIDDTLARRLADALAHEAPPADLARDAGWSAWRERGVDAALFLDLETTGLAAMPVFLCGLLSCHRGEMSFRLLLARDYGEEAALLSAVAEELGRRPVVVTFNGKSYDLPYLAERAGRLRTAPSRPVAHLDLLHAARRRWAGKLPDCRLKTLERHVLGRHRGGDIDGAEIPDTYHRFVRERDPRPLVRVMAHNLHDLYTLAELTVRTARTPVPAPIPSSESPDI